MLSFKAHFDFETMKLMKYYSDNESGVSVAIRVLHVLDGLKSGGAESFIMNMYRGIDRELVQFDFLLRSKNNNPSLIEEAKSLGANITILSSFPRHVIRNYKETNKFFMGNQYEIVHVHANALIYIIPFILGKRNGITHRILHSHSTMTMRGNLLKAVHYWHRLFIDRLATDLFSCGQEAGEWMFGNRDYTLLNNAIDIKKYSYDSEKRSRMRKEMGLGDKLVIGHVGRFSEVKNHKFIIEIFNEILMEKKDAVLMLVGIGDEVENIKKQVASLGIKEQVLFLGQRGDVADLMQIMDVFLFPSLYEGLPFVLIEAQASGLPIITSDAVSLKTKITELVKFVPLHKSDKEWSNIAIEVANNTERSNNFLKIKKAKYDIVDNAKSLTNIYLNMQRAEK